jgi:ABC-type antimicrobial peptide transport system permease subunit
VDQESEREQIYYSFLQRPWPDMSLVVRSASADPLSLAGPVRAGIREIDGDQPAAAVRSMRDWYAESLSKPKFSMLLLSLFALVSLVLVAVGTYGVIASSTLERTQEIGIRMALGARRWSALELVVRHSLSLALLGVTIGVLLALLSTRLLKSQVHRLSVTDPLTIAGVSLFLLVIVLVASLLPAYRATRVDPVLALRRQ